MTTDLDVFIASLLKSEQVQPYSTDWSHLETLTAWVHEYGSYELKVNPYGTHCFIMIVNPVVASAGKGIDLTRDIIHAHVSGRNIPHALCLAIQAAFQKAANAAMMRLYE
jgi:hypothetical protein